MVRNKVTVYFFFLPAAASGWPLPDLTAAEVSFPGFAARLATLEPTVA